MKKLLTILAILMVLIGSVYATTELHTIRIKSIIPVTTPAFKLEFTSGMATGISVSTDVDSDVNEYGTEDTAIIVADISQKNLDLLFTVKLANEAKCTDIFNIQFTAGPFAVRRNGQPGYLNPDENPVLAAAADIADRVGVRATDIENGTLKLRFNGADCTTGNLATFRVQFSADSTIDDNNEGEYYYADICLEVTAET